MNFLDDMTRNHPVKTEVFYAAPLLTIYAIYEFSSKRKYARLEKALHSIAGVQENLFEKITYDLRPEQRELVVML
jgi:hypothetical protein